MIIFKSIKVLNNNVNFNNNIGFVPTMGALHEGHISLIKASKRKCQKTIVSIFIIKCMIFLPNQFIWLIVWYF